MKIEWQDYLNTTYNFHENYYGNQVSYECGDGWFQLLKDMFDELRDQMEMDGIEKIHITQIKEKFGSLRVYADFPNEKIDAIIGKYEDKSYHVCEQCGLPSHLRTFRGWVYNMCDPCYHQMRTENKYVD
jgi:hypothetical protein